MKDSLRNEAISSAHQEHYSRIKGVTQMQQRPWYLSTVVIVLAFIFFWPVGILLVFLRAQGSSMDKQAVFKGASNQKLYVIGGALLVLIGLSNLFTRYSNKGWAVFMIIGGGILIYYSTRIAKKAAVHRRRLVGVVMSDAKALPRRNSR